jgi:hypothetical protein
MSTNISLINVNNTLKKLSIEESQQECVDISIKYSQLLNPKEEDHTFLNDLFKKGDSFKERIKFFLSQKKSIIIENVPLSDKDESTCSTLKVNIYKKYGMIVVELVDSKNEQGFKAQYYDDGSSAFTKVDRNEFSGNINVKVGIVILSILGLEENKLSDSSYVQCECLLNIDLHTFRLLTCGKGWYIGSHGYLPEIGLEKYLESTQYFQDLTLGKLEKEIKQWDFKNGGFINGDKLEDRFRDFFNKMKEIFDQSVENSLFPNEQLDSKRFSDLTFLLHQSKDKKLHDIFHRFIKEVDLVLFYNDLLRTEFQYNSLLPKKIEGTLLGYQVKMYSSSSNLFKKIKIMKF